MHNSSCFVGSPRGGTRRLDEICTYNVQFCLLVHFSCSNAQRWVGVCLQIVCSTGGDPINPACGGTFPGIWHRLSWQVIYDTHDIVFRILISLYIYVNKTIPFLIFRSFILYTLLYICYSNKSFFASMPRKTVVYFYLFANLLICRMNGMVRCVNARAALRVETQLIFICTCTCGSHLMPSIYDTYQTFHIVSSLLLLLFTHSGPEHLVKVYLNYYYYYRRVSWYIWDISR